MNKVKIKETLPKQYTDLANVLDINIDQSIDVSISGEATGPLLCLRNPLTDCLTSMLSLQGAMVAEIWRRKTGESQSVSVDRDHAMKFYDRVYFIRINGRILTLDAFNNPTSRTHKVADGFIETTTTLRHLHEGTLEVLQCWSDYQICNQKFLQWNADDLETELETRGLCGVKIRTQEDWRSHPQGKILNEKPVVDITKIGSAPAVPWNRKSRPLEGIRVLDLSKIIAGPLVGNMLAEQGADVLHIARMGDERILSNLIDTGFGKRCAFLDLEESADHERLLELVKTADVFINGYAPNRLAEKFGLSVEKLTELNPNLIYVTSSAFGSYGPWGHYKGWENMAQAATGMMFDHGNEETPLLTPVGLVTDYGTGCMGTLGVLAALLKRSEAGGSYHVEVSLAKTAMWYQDQGKGPVLDIEKVKEALRIAGEGGHTDAPIMKTQTSYGTITHMAPVIQYSKIHPYWLHPTPILGQDEPYWEDPLF